MNSFDTAVSLLHQHGLKGEGVLVGHLDTGVDGAQPALAGRIAGFQRFGYRGIEEETTSAFDSGWHGTFTAVLVAGQLIENQQLGVAPAALIYSGMVIEEGNIIARILSGLDWLLTCRVQVVLLSLGIFSQTPIFRSLIQEMENQDVLVICPSGNRGAGQTPAPGYYAEPLTVGAVDVNGRIPSFSGSYHPDGTTICMKPDVLAPGVDIVSAVPGGILKTKSGTSMAAAKVAGLAALLRGAFPQIPAHLVKKALITSCTPCLPDQTHRAASGIIDPEKAYHLLARWVAISSEVEVNANETSYNKPSTKYIDSWLMKQLEITADSDLCEIVIEFENWESAHELTRRVTSCSGFDSSQKGSIKLLQHRPISICQVPKSIVKQILAWSPVCAASASDIARWG